MSFSKEEEQIILRGLRDGQDKNQLRQAIADHRTGRDKPVAVQSRKSYMDSVRERWNAAIDSAGTGLYEAGRSDRGFVSKTLQAGGALAGGFLGALEAPLPQGVQKAIDWTGEKAGQGIGYAADRLSESEIMQKYALTDVDREKNPLLYLLSAKNVENVLRDTQNVSMIAAAGLAGNEAIDTTRLVGAGINKGVVQPISKLTSDVKTTISEMSNMVHNPNVSMSGITQKIKDLGARVPRAFEKGRQSIQESAEKAQRLATASPATRQAINVELDDVLVRGVSDLDDATARAAREMMDIADTQKTLRGDRIKPSKVYADAAVQQYEIVDGLRKAVGKNIENAVNALPDQKVYLGTQLGKLDNILRQNGLYLRGGLVVRDAGSTLTEAELKAVQKLYNETLRGIDNLGRLNASAIHARDRIFSKLKRESMKIDNLDDILIKSGDGAASIYDTFRDVFRESLDDIDNGNIRALNRQYAIYRTAVDEMDNSLFKTAKTKLDIDPADSAAINLRRIEGEALSTPQFQKAVETLDVISRANGYDGPRVADLVSFGEELRKLYPETIPKTGFQGGIRTGMRDLAERALNLGKPDYTDQRAALRALIDERLGQNTTTAISKTTAPMSNTSKRIIDESVPLFKDKLKVTK